ncbi:MAG: hypothetical protein SOY30_00225 [Eubacteriales bacterium]|nr:hypothetical protein [Eubacteriales bacterium]
MANERLGGHPPHLMIQHFQEKSNSLNEISSFLRRIFHPFAQFCIKAPRAMPEKKSALRPLSRKELACIM